MGWGIGRQSAQRLDQPSAPGRSAFARAYSRHGPWIVDVLLAMVYLVVAVASAGATGQWVTRTVGGVTSTTSTSFAPWLLVVYGIGTVLLAATLAVFRRRKPWLAVAAVWIATLALPPVGSAALVPLAIVSYAVPVYLSTRPAWIVYAGSIVVVTLSTLFGALSSLVTFDSPPATLIAQAAVILLVFVLIGIITANRRKRLAALVQRAHDLSRERDQQAHLATVIERSRIAREMHDIVAHSLTVMITLSDGAAATAKRDPARASSTMNQVAETGRSALIDMRRMLGVLADSPPSEVSSSANGHVNATDPSANELSPQPDEKALPGLIATYRNAGLPITLITKGTPIDNPNLELNVYRIVQEALTNVLRYASSASEVSVDVRHTKRQVTLEIRDDAVVPPSVREARAEALGSGRGVLGMR